MRINRHDELQLLANIRENTSGLIHFEGTPEAIFAKAILAMNPESAYAVTVNFWLLDPDEKEAEAQD